MKRVGKLHNWMIAFSISLVFVLLGCQSETPESTITKQNETATLQHHDVQETTKGADELPSFVKELDPMVGKVYQVVAKNQKLLEWIPCYCGCGEDTGHRNNLDCFVKEANKNGEITWDSHGTTCGTCLEIAAESASLKEQGKSTLEIRRYIDNKYKEGFAKPTPTPMPTEQTS